MEKKKHRAVPGLEQFRQDICASVCPVPFSLITSGHETPNLQFCNNCFIKHSLCRTHCRTKGIKKLKEVWEGWDYEPKPRRSLTGI